MQKCFITFFRVNLVVTILRIFGRKFGTQNLLGYPIAAPLGLSLLCDKTNCLDRTLDITPCIYNSKRELNEVFD